MLELGLESGSFRAATAQRSQNFEAKAGVRRTARRLSAGQVDEVWLGHLEWHDNIFPEIDYRVYLD